MSLPLAKPPDQRTPFDKGNQWHDWLYKLWSYVQTTALGGTVTGAVNEGSGVGVLDAGTTTPTTLHLKSISGAGTVTVTDSGTGVVITGTSTGTVTSVGLSLPASVFTVTGSPVTTSGTLTGSFRTSSANLVFAGPASGAAAVPTFRTLVPADLPVASGSTLGIVRPDNSSVTISGGVLSSTGSGGTVTSVGLALPASVFTIIGTAITTSGTLTAVFSTQNQNMVFAGPTSGSAAPTFRALVPNDLPTATSSALGIVKPDNSTITISGGVISATTSATVSSVGLALPASVFSVSGSPVTTSGTLTGAFTAQTANTVFAGPSSGSAATPTFRAVVPADLPVATTSAFGAVKPDGTTITVSSGVISSVAGSGRLLNVQVLTSSTTYTATAGTNSIIVEIIGGGGGGGGTAATSAAQIAAGSGGGSGNYCKARLTSSFTPTTVTIGAGGAATAGLAGGNGGQSSFGATVVVGGGALGNTAIGLIANGDVGAISNAAGSTITGGNIIATQGTQGAMSLTTISGAMLPGAGATTMLGYGGAGSQGSIGHAGSGYGSGGGGVSSGASTAAIRGGFGAPGVCIVYEYS